MTPTPRRITAGWLDRLAEQLTSRERMVLQALATVHVMTTAQLARLVFGGQQEATALRLARRHLQRLRRFELVRRFDDRAWDRQVGAPGYIHTLTAAGLRLSSGQHATPVRQRAAWRPSHPMLTHRLAVSELYVRLKEQERAGGPNLREFKAEPESWRLYTGAAGRLLVKPDALARLGIGDVEVSWFVEIDKGTGRPATIAGKCRSYRTYELSGEEQRRHGGFPGVIFIVPSLERARVIAEEFARQPADAQELFAVTTEDEALVALAQTEGSGLLPP